MPAFDDWVRVQFDNGAEGSVAPQTAEAFGLKPLKKPAIGNDGQPLPTKLRVPKGAVNQPDHLNPEASPASDAQEG